MTPTDVAAALTDDDAPRIFLALGIGVLVLLLVAIAQFKTPKE